MSEIPWWGLKSVFLCLRLLQSRHSHSVDPGSDYPCGLSVSHIMCFLIEHCIYYHSLFVLDRVVQ